MALDPASTAAPIRITEKTPAAEHSKLAQQAGATYEASAGRARVLEIAIIVVTVLSSVEVIALDFIATRLSIDDETGLVRGLLVLIGLVLLELVAWVAALVAWGAWLSRVVANVPILGGGWPKSTPREAFVASIIPLYNLYWSASVVRDVITRLAPAGKARTGLITAWWLTLILSVLPALGLIPSPFFVFRIAYIVVANLITTTIEAIVGSPLNASLIVNVINAVLLIVAASLALQIVGYVEELQAARRSEVAPPDATPAEA